MTQAQHVMAEAPNDADDRRKFISDNLGTAAQIKQNRTRSAKQDIDPALYKESRLVDFFEHNEALSPYRPVLEEDRISVQSIRLSRLHNGIAPLN